MKFMQKIRLWAIISISGFLLPCTGICGTTVDPYRQFLEVVNYSDKEVSIATRDSGEKFSFRVAPGERERFPDALAPGYQSLFLLIGPHEVNNPITTEGFAVDNFEKKTFLHGQQLTISKTGDYNIKHVRFLHGVWRMQETDPKDGPREWQLNLSHVHAQFSGSFTYVKTGDKIPISGTMADQLMTFHLDVGADATVNGKLRITPDGKWTGSLKYSYMEDGKRQSMTEPLVFQSDFQKKTLVFIKVED